VKLVYIVDRTCHRKLVPGQVKRLLQTGGLVGYWVACPACTRIRQYPDSDVGFIETPASPGGPRTILGTRSPLRCEACGVLVQIGDGEICAVS